MAMTQTDEASLGLPNRPFIEANAILYTARIQAHN